MTRRAPADQKRSRWICPLVFAVFAAAPVLPVAAYHALALNDPTPIQANSGFNFYLGNNPNATGGCYLRPGPEWEKIHAEAEKRGKTTRGKDHYFYAKAFAYIRERPLEWTATTAKKALYVWNGQELISGADPAPIREFTLIQKIGTVGFGAIAALGLAAVFTRAPSRSFRYRYRYFIVLALAYWLAQTVFVTSGRYRVAMLIGLVPPAANACWDFYVAWTRRHRRPIVRYILATIMAGMVICLPRPVVNEAAERGEAASLLGEAYQTLGRALDAVEYLKVAAEAMPNWSRHYNLLGNAFSDLGNNAEAEKYYRQALAVEPADPLTLTNLAILAKKTDRLELADRYLALAEANAKFLRGRSRSIVCYNIGLRYAEKDDRVAAERFYRQALDYFPSNREAINNLAVLALDQGHSGEAVTLFRKATRLAPDNYRAWVNLSIAELENKAPERARLALENALKIYPEFGRTEVYRQLRGRIEAAPRAPIMPNLFGPPVIGGDTERSR